MLSETHCARLNDPRDQKENLATHANHSRWEPSLFILFTQSLHDYESWPKSDSRKRCSNDYWCKSKCSS
ncbi:hypothetical protein BDW71DRAFT_186190 [Aspergillus fruticulosus]